MITVAEFAAHLERSIALVRPEIERGLIELGELTAKLAQSYIGHEHEDWPALAPATIEEKAAQGYAVPAPLLRTGDMRDSIKANVDVLDYTMIVGSNDPKAVWHEFGTTRMPPRPFLSRAMLSVVGQGGEAYVIFGAAAGAVLRGGVR
jgi:phage gpG-like protein